MKEAVIDQSNIERRAIVLLETIVPVSTDFSLIHEQDFFTVGSRPIAAGFNTYENMGQGLDMFLGPTGFGYVVDVACFCICHLIPREVSILYNILGRSYRCNLAQANRVTDSSQSKGVAGFRVLVVQGI